MKAAVSARYGSPDGIEIRQVSKPQPKPGEVLVKVHATTVSRTDCGMLQPHPRLIRLVTGLIRPKLTILGMDFAGTVESVGTDVTSFEPGDRVFGLSPERYGAHAEYLCVPEKSAIVAMPTGLKFDEVVVGEGAWYANTYLKKFGLKPGHRILIYGASGAIGSAAVQMAKAYGAEVTAVAGSRHLDLVRSLGADAVIDYTAQDFTKTGETYDFVLDAVGKTTFFRCRNLLTPTGVFAATDLGRWCQNIFLAIWTWMTGSHRVVFPTPKNARTTLQFVKARMEEGEFRAVIDRSYPLEEIADAYRYVETEQKTGIVVINVIPADANDRTQRGSIVAGQPN